MKITIEVDCTPHEAREFMGLPDINEANAVYVDSMKNAIKSAKTPEQMKDFVRDLAPMGEAGMKLMQSFLGAGFGAAGAGSERARSGEGDQASGKGKGKGKPGNKDDE